jgi:hypothetical protein
MNLAVVNSMSIRLIACVAVIGLALVASPAVAALSFTYNYVDDAGGTFASRGWLSPDSLFQRNIRAAADTWGAQFNSNATVVVRVDTTSYSVRAGGTGTLGRFLYENAAGKDIWEPGVLTRILTGDNPGEDFFGYDIVLGFDASYVDGHYWFDPQPTLRTDSVPGSKGDFISVVMHELGHGFGLTGYRDFTGQIFGDVGTIVDDLSYFGGNGQPFGPSGAPNPMFFGGDQAAAVYGADLPLTHKPLGDLLATQNFYHLSACDPGAPDGLETTLMNGCEIPTGDRLFLTPVDRALFGDLGYPLVPAISSPADFNNDGSVDGLDLVVWRAAYGTSTAGDADDDGDSDGSDFLIWQRGLTGASAVAIPEPAGAAMATIGVAPLLARTRRSARVQ